MLKKYSINRGHFELASSDLPAYFEELLNCPPVRSGLWDGILQPKYAGVYYFKKRKAIYVGESNNIFRRYNHHASTGGTSSFVLKKVREHLAIHHKDYDYLSSQKKSNKEIEQHSKYRYFIKKATSEIRAMEFRYVRVYPSFKRKLLEIYCTIALGTAYLWDYSDDVIVKCNIKPHTYPYYNSFS